MDAAWQQLFPYAASTLPGFVLAGVIWSVALGFAAGNYACSLVHRLPRGRAILDKKPYCGSCGTPLATRDLFPVVSALLLRHKCRYCAASIPKTHFWTEILIGALFALCYLRFGFSQSYFLIAALGVFFVVLASIEVNDRIVMKSVLIAVAVLGMVTRTYLDGGIYGFFYGALYGAIVGAVLWRRDIQRVNHIYVLPPPAQLLAVAGLCAGEQGILPMFLLLAVFFPALLLLHRARGGEGKPPMSIAVGFSVMVPLMFGLAFPV